MKFINGVPDYVLHWEAYDHLHYKGEFEALIEMQKLYVKKHPDQIREKLMLADAYGYAGKHLQALKILKRLHRYDPYDFEFTHAIIECLDKLGKNPKLYDWKREVIIFDTSEEATQWCYTYMQREGVSDNTLHLFLEMDVTGFTRFDEDELLDFLKEDARFMIHEGEDMVDSVVELREWQTSIRTCEEVC